MTTAQLSTIYNCAVTNWSHGGGNAPIQAYLPGLGSDITTLFLNAIGVHTPGSCVNTTAVQPDEGVSTVFNNPAVIVPYSVADYIGQAEHSAACTNGGCNPPGCTPSVGQNQFGCNETGYLQINPVSGIAPASPWPLAATSTVNSAFPAAFQSPMSEVVHHVPPGNHIPAALQPFFGPAGWACTTTTAAADIASYGFLNLGTNCGTVH